MKKLKTTFLLFVLIVSMLSFMSFKPVFATTTTTTFMSSTSDGSASYLLPATPYNTVWTAVNGISAFDEDDYTTIGQWYVGLYFTVGIRRGMFYFDTSSIPDLATITNAVISLYIWMDASTDKEFDVVIQNGQPTYPHDPMELSDYNKELYSGDGGSRHTTDGLSEGSYWNITLNVDGLSWINKTTTTKLCLRSSLDISGTEATGTENIEVYTREKGTSYAPKLYVTYTTYELDIDSVPSTVSFTLNGDSESTPFSESVGDGSWQINFTDSFERAGFTWTFAYWDDDTSNTNPDRTIDLEEDTSLSVTYSSGAVKTRTTDQAVLAMDMEQFVYLPYENTLQNSWLMDSSIYRNHGEPLPYPAYTYGGPTKVKGVFAYALLFDGEDDTVLIPNSVSLNISNAITVSFWMYPYNTTADQKMVSKYTEWVVGMKDSKLYVQVWTSGSVYNDNTVAIENKEWSFVTFTYDYTDGYYSIWVDSVEKKQVATDGNKINTTDTDLYLGQIDYTGNQPYQGILDEVKIYPFALIGNEIKREQVSQLFDHKQQRWFMYVEEETGWDWEPNPDVHDFVDNDPTLPQVNRTGAYEGVQIWRSDFIAGFQTFEVNAVFEDTSGPSLGSYTQGFTWHLIFFKDGEWQVRYYIQLYQRTCGPNQMYWQVISAYQTKTQWEEGPTVTDLQTYIFHVSETAEPTSWPFLVQAWTTEDNKQLAVRVVSKNTTTDGVGEYMFSYFFDLVDKNGNKVYLQWYDPWIVRNFIVRAEDDDGVVRVLQHNWDLIDWIVRTVTGFFTGKSGLGMSYELAQVIAGQEPTVPDDPNDPDDGAPNPLFDPLGYIGWMLKDALNSIGINLDPLISAIQNSVGTGLLKFWEMFVDFLDRVFTTFGWTNGFSEILSFIGSLVSWVGTALSFVVSLLGIAYIFVTTAFTYAFAGFTGFISALGGVVDSLYWMWAQVSGPFGWVLTSAYQLLPLFFVFYLIWLLSPLIEKGNWHGTKQRVEDTIGIIVKVAMFGWMIFERLFDMVYKLGELVPLAE